ncbi:MAG: TonB-dependent receptor [Candidatus Symbiothrix sp.]|jgi:outer membrane cobalamin receptor|nr:TonB-dependent receptor [Candidatus Symbiothrix sp.]
MKIRQLKRVTFLVTTLFWAFAAAAQTTVKGQLTDAATGEPLVGVSISVQGTTRGTVSDLDGMFTIETAGNETLSFKYVGYKPVLKGIKTGAVDLKTIAMESDAFALDDVIITSSIAVERQTPVALSSITPQIIEEKLGTKEFPEILNSTPGVYATKQGGGFGDSRINLRGFESANVAVMVNGVPMNDMEWGGVYWSNWAGLGDVTRLMQVQRGLGASKVSAPSVGGSINIITKSTDAKKGGAVSYAMGNDGYNKVSFSVSTGLMDNGWAITLLGAKTSGNGYIQGTEFEGYSYFFNIAKRIGTSQQLSLTAFGAPQWHNQRYNGDKLFISDWQTKKDGYRYNPSYGFANNGQRKTASYNYYHKPQISLNHLWDINEKSNISTALYTSIGRGGGYGARGNNSNDLYGTTNGVLNTKYRTIEGYMDYAQLEADNAANPNGSQAIIASSRNEHNWYGLLSTYTTKIQNIDLYTGIDMRYYEGMHDAIIVDLMGGEFFIDPDRANLLNSRRNDPAYTNARLREGDIVYRDNTGYVAQEGVFAQAEYSKNALNVFVSGSLSNSSYWKIDHFYLNNEKSAVGNFLGYTAKGGANYNLNPLHNVFANIGYISRAPFMSGGYFTNIHRSNVVNKDAVNEKVFSIELGYGFRSQYLTANLNLYRTNWLDRTTIRTLGDGQNDPVVNLTGIDALHQGIELEVVAKPIKRLEIKGMLSLGDWRWINNASGYVYSKDGQPVNKSGKPIDANDNPIAEFSTDHDRVIMNLENVKVGNSAQTTAFLGVQYELLKNFNTGLDFHWYADNYADFKISANSGETTYITPWKIPAAGILDFNANYRFKIGGLDATLYGNIDNLLNQEYIADAQDLTPTTAEPDEWKNGVSVIYGFGRTYSVSLKVKF